MTGPHVEYGLAWTTRSVHDCPGLRKCTSHPKWIVHQHPGGEWVTVHPGEARYSTEHDTQPEAFTYAQTQATKEQP